MSSGDEKLFDIAEKLRKGETVGPVSVRAFLGWFGAQRRSYWNVWSIRRGLQAANLVTNPEFESAYIDSEIRFEFAPNHEAVDEDKTAESFETEGQVQSTAQLADPTYRISKLAAANNKPTAVDPDAHLKEAVTLMMANDFSQLPVMTNERDTKGVISWNSIGARIVLGKNRTFVREVMDTHYEIRFDASMFQAIPTIVHHGYVLIRGADSKVSGIVTASDLSLQFQQLAEPFLLLSEIENHIRGLLHGKFEKSDLAGAKNPADSGREIEEVSDLTFGEYVRLLENDDRWCKIRLNLDRKTFCKNLEEVRTIRNEVMHFDPDGVLPQDLERLRDFARFLQRIQIINRC
jgi:CBS domain-containing protein